MSAPAPEQAAARWDEFRAKIAAWLTRQTPEGRDTDWAGVWASQERTDERGEVGHLMLHCPLDLQSSLRQVIRRWVRTSGDGVLVRRVEWARDARTRSLRCSVPNFITDQVGALDARAVDASREGGPAGIPGARCGTSEALDRRARMR